MALLLIVLVASLLAGSGPKSGPCQAPLPRGPSVPAPIVLQTSCGGFRLAPDGRISRLPPRWFAIRQGGTGRRYGADIKIRRTRPGRIILRRQGRVLWSSKHLYRNDAGDIAFGPNAFAFASFRRGIFVTDLRGAERLIVRGVGLVPLAFVRDGTLLVARRRSVSVVSEDGVVLGRHRYREKNGFAFDQRTESLFFVTPDRRLARANRTRVRAIRPLDDLDGWLYLLDRNLLVFQESREVAVTRRNGSIIARTRWRGSGWVLDSGLSASDDGRAFAFRLMRPAAHARKAAAVVYVLRAGETKAYALYRHRANQSGCAVGASLTWDGDALLYSSTDGGLAVFEMRGGRAQPLDEVAAALPRQGSGDRVAAHWASDFPRPRLSR